MRRRLASYFCCIWLICFTAAPADGLELTNPSAVDMDSARLDAAVEKLKQGAWREIDSLLVLRRGALVLEYYARPDYYGREYRQTWRSVSKSVTAIVVGLLLEQKRITGVDVPIRELISEYVDPEVDDPRKDELTLEQVLTMTTGFEWAEFYPPYGDPKNDYSRMTRTSDWMAYVFEKPLVDSPGTRLEYNGANTLMLSAMVQQATGVNVEDFARKQLFEPLGIENWSWPLAHADLTNTATGLGMRRIDMARIGQLMLQEGRWGNRQVLLPGTVAEMTRERIAGRGNYDGLAYGYHWWRFTDDNPMIRGLERNDVYFAYGNEGQLLMIVPHLDLVVVSTASLFGKAWSLQFELIRDHVFTAVRD